jgi:hypothetical protein
LDRRLLRFAQHGLRAPAIGLANTPALFISVFPVGIPCIKGIGHGHAFYGRIAGLFGK